MSLASPLDRHLKFASSDVAEVRSQISRYFRPHNIRFLDGSQRLSTVLRRVNVGQLAVNVLEYGGNVMIDPGSLDDFYLIHINVRGECELTHPGGHMTINAGRAAICGPSRPYRFWWQPDSQVVAIQIPKNRLAGQVARLTGQTVKDLVDFDLAIDLEGDQGRALMDLVRYILSDANNPGGLTSYRATSLPLEQALLSTLLRFQPGSHQDAISYSFDSTAPGYVRRAEQFMNQHLSRTIKMSELAQVAGVTERTLTNGFQRFRGTSPGRHFQSLRLSRVRAALEAAAPGNTVSDIAFDLGFSNLSSLSSAYRRRYGETPSETLRKSVRLH
ncbi:MAG: AraC family transcriptional regulator [Pseudomonadota bacterium]